LTNDEESTRSRKISVAKKSNLDKNYFMPDFEEIGSAGGKMQILHDSDGRVSLQLSSDGGGPFSAFQIGAALDGSVFRYQPLRGMDMRPPKPPPQLAPIMIVSDREGFFGRNCPNCKGYFRTTNPREVSICPYCAHRNRNEAFTTKNQLLFIAKVCESYRDAIENKQDVTIDLGRIAADLPSNRPAWAYSEERQQNRFNCVKECHTSFDILGEYAGCPSCGKRNSMVVFEKHISEIEREFNEAEEKLTDPLERQVEWEKLSRCVSDFEAMARDIQNQLVLFPATPKRKKEIGQISFQNIVKANNNLLNFFGLEIFSGLPEDDKVFLNRIFNRRHVLTHNGGKVDQEYLDNTRDTTVRLHQKIVVRSKEIRRLIPLLRKCALSLFTAFESIK
jgi:hypothetical protein